MMNAVHSQANEAAVPASATARLRLVMATNASFGFGPLIELLTGNPAPIGRRKLLLRETVSPQTSNRFEYSPSLDSETTEQLEIVLFVDARASVREMLRLVRDIHRFRGSHRVQCVIVIESLAIHQADSCAIAMEEFLVETLKPLVDQLTLLRTGHLCWKENDSLNVPRWLRRLLPECLTSTFVEIHSLRCAIDDVLRSEENVSSSSLPFRFPCHRISVPGRRWPLCKSPGSLEPENCSGRIEQSETLGRTHLLKHPSLVHRAIHRLVGLATPLLKSVSPVFRRLTPDELKPRTVQELLSLCHRYSRADIQIAGYNNGVHHFGWKFPEKTVVSTASMEGRIRMSRDRITADAGKTLFDCIQALKPTDREFCVVPNYSFIAMGTLFFVPIHGSGSRVSTMGETIEKVLLYHCETGEFVSARRGSGVFQDAMYHRSSPWIVLRLTLRTQARQNLKVETTVLNDPSAAELCNQLQNPDASHVEIRKTRAADSKVTVRACYSGEQTDTDSAQRTTTDLPRDQIGRLWDRIEQTPVLSTVFHWYVRTRAFHTELFLTAAEFEVFWTHHRSLPLSKIQIRQMRQDGMQHSPCRSEDLISVDLFMSRRNHDVFCRFISDYLPNARHNPGKQSPGTHGAGTPNA